MPPPPSPIPERMQMLLATCRQTLFGQLYLNISDRNHYDFTGRKLALSLPSLLLPSRMSQGIWETFAFVFRVVFSFLSCPSDITVQ